MTNRWDHWRTERRQRRQHAVFRIDAPRWDEAERRRLTALVAELREWAATTTTATTTATATAELAEPPMPGDVRGAVEAATNLWRARRRLARLAEQTSETKRLGRYLTATEEALAEFGLRIQDHDGTAFHPGLSLEVLAYEEDPDCGAEVVRETVRPSVYFAGRRVQTGQVIVAGSPETTAVDGTGETADTNTEGNHA